MRRVIIALGTMGVLGLAACGGGGDSGATTRAPAATSATTAATTRAATTTKPASATTTRTTSAGAGQSTEGLPQFLSDFDQVCNTQVGFGGAKPYAKTPGVHKVVFFDDYRGESQVESSSQLPEEWIVTEDANFEDNSELAEIELVACSERTAERPTGKKCDLDDDGTTVTLELVDDADELKVYEATTGKEVGGATIEAERDDCPSFTFYQKGDTTHVAEPDEDDYINALKAHVVT